MPKTTLTYSAIPSRSISAHRLLGIILPITNYNLLRYNSAWSCSKFGMASIPARSKPRSCSLDFPPILPVHIHLLTHKFTSSRSWQEGKTFLMSWLTLICSRKESMEQFGPPEFSDSFSSAAPLCIIFFIATPAPSLSFNYCCAPLLRALHDNFYVSLLRKTLKILGPSAYEKISLFLLMCIT